VVAHRSHDPLLGAAGAPEDPGPEESDVPEDEDGPEDEEDVEGDEDDEDDEDDVLATLVTGPAGAGAAGVRAAPGTYRTVMRVTYGRCRSPLSRSTRRCDGVPVVVVGLVSVPVAPCSAE
jgi:hypothetical protein